MSQKILQIFCLVVIILLSFIIYFKTLSPTVSFIDSGELAVVCQTLGIAHPTGYPLYTLLGRIFTFLPLKDTIFRVNLLSLICVVSTNIFLFLILSLLSQGFVRSSSSKIVHLTIKFLIPLISTLIFVFTPILWSQATSNEVYALHIFLMTFLIYLTLLWWQNSVKNAKLFYLIIFLYGLSFGNHMSSVLLAPALFILFLIHYQKSLFIPTRIFAVFSLFVLGFSIYLFLPIRSSQNPLLDWGNPETWFAFKRHITAWQYQVWIFSETSQELSHRFFNYLKLFIQQFPWYLLPVGVLGLVSMLKKHLPVAVFLFLYFLLDIFFGINYTIADIQPYFLPSFLIFALWLGLGLGGILAFLLQQVEKSNPANLVSAAVIFPTILLLLPLLNLTRNYREQDQSQNYFAYDFCQNVLKSVEKNGIILTDVWDLYSPWLYIRHIEKQRPDVVFLDKELFRRSWYFKYIKKTYPEIYKNSEAEIGSFLEQLKLFEGKKPYDPVVIEGRYQRLYNSFWLNNYDSNPAYALLLGRDQIQTSLLGIPEGLVFRMRKDTAYYPLDFPSWELRGVLDQQVFKDKRTLFYLSEYPVMLQKRASYLTDFKQEALAQPLFIQAQMLQKALETYQK